MTSKSDPLAQARPRRWASMLLRLLGWEMDMRPPTGPKALLIVYPHTSNWDFPLGLLVKWACGWPVRWIGKHTIFVGPFGRILRSWGGIPVNRSAAGGFIESLGAEIRSHETLLLAMAPEGTRRYEDHWKSGFMRIALGADLPLGLVCFDYRRKRVAVLEYLKLSGDEATDLARIAAAYQGVEGYIPKNASPIRLRPERRASDRTGGKTAA